MLKLFILTSHVPVTCGHSSPIQSFVSNVSQHTDHVKIVRFLYLKMHGFDIILTQKLEI